MNKSIHIPVMTQEVLAFLQAKAGGKFLDCTLGGGGHTHAILEANSENTVTAIDRDRRAIARAQDRLSTYKARVRFVHASFSDLASLSLSREFDGMLADLGVSTDQLREKRGFSFEDSVRLDMRMDECQQQSAYELINETSERDLFITLRKGGVGTEAKLLARAIVRARPLENTDELAAVINRTLSPQFARRKPAKKVNPATVAFQAIRMAVNDELGEIEKLMNVAPTVVKSKGRFAVISFHSLEDKVVGSIMRRWEGRDRSALWPGQTTAVQLGELITRKAVVAEESEVKSNPSARSARLRVFEFR